MENPVVTSGVARWRRMARSALLPIAVLVVLAVGAVLHANPGTQQLTAPLLMAGLVLTGGPVIWRTLRGLAAGHFAADLVASMAILTAVLLQQPIPGLIVVLMQTGGEALERYAEGRASRALHELERAAPRLAHRVVGDTVLDVTAEDVVVGEMLLIRPGEMVPCDAVVLDGGSHVDTSQLTGEPIPVRAAAGSTLMSGSLPWHQFQIEEVLRLLDVDVTTGLSGTEIKLCREKFGRNRVTARRGTPVWLKFLQQFNQPLVYILVLAGGVTAALGEWVDFFVIFTVVLINAIVGFLQEAKVVVEDSASLDGMCSHSSVQFSQAGGDPLNLKLVGCRGEVLNVKTIEEAR